jgi:hypothetical protein
MAQQVKRAKGSNQYSEKLESVSVEERRLPRKRRQGMAKSGAMMATPGKPFQCPTCAMVNATGTVCANCRGQQPGGTLVCPGCREASIPTGGILCANCESLTLQPQPQQVAGAPQAFQPMPQRTPPQNYAPPAAPPPQYVAPQDGMPVTPPPPNTQRPPGQPNRQIPPPPQQPPQQPPFQFKTGSPPPSRRGLPQRHPQGPGTQGT